MMVMENQQPVVQMQLVPVSLPPQVYKHHCKVCKKGFMCGRALGGHMRAHDIGDNGLGADDTLDDDLAPYGGGGPGESSETGSPLTTTTKRMYALRTNPGRLRNCRVCENCGKEFTSWKSLLDHGRCSFDEDDDLDGSLRSSPLQDSDDGEEEEEEDLALAAGWSKGKRSRRAKVMAVGSCSISKLQLPTPSSEEEDLANCLVMLSSSGAAQPVVVDADQESCSYASKDEAERNRLLVPQPISMVAPAAAQVMALAPQHVPTVLRGMFECKACKKVFTSHQALGGHRASHKKVKGCFAAKLESNRNETHQQHVAAAPHDNTKAIADVIVDTSTDAKTASVNANADGKATNVGAGEVVMGLMATATPEMVVMAVDDIAPAPYAVSPFKKKGKVHECSVCHRVFTSGQALGGHKRCHWLTSSATDPAGAVAKLQPVAPDHVMAAVCRQLTLGRPMFDTTDQHILDLNVPTNPSAEAVASKQAADLNDSPLCLNTPASMYMQSWTGHNNVSHVNKTATSSRNDPAAGGSAATEDEADSTSAKRTKISDLKDMNVAGESLPWLQVGIGFSSSEIKEKSTQK